MAERYRKNWRELCNSAIAARDTDELLRIIHELNTELEREEKVRRTYCKTVYPEYHQDRFPPPPKTGAESGEEPVVRRPNWLLFFENRMKPQFSSLAKDASITNSEICAAKDIGSARIQEKKGE